MSTRALITVKDDHDTFHIYRHSDGYPDTEYGVLADLQRVVESDQVWPLPRFEADEFAAAIPAVLKERAGNYRLSTGPEAHGDIEYWYKVYPLLGRVVVKWQGHGEHGETRLTRKATVPK